MLFATCAGFCRTLLHSEMSLSQHSKAAWDSLQLIVRLAPPLLYLFFNFSCYDSYWALGPLNYKTAFLFESHKLSKSTTVFYIFHLNWLSFLFSYLSSVFNHFDLSVNGFHCSQDERCTFSLTFEAFGLPSAHHFSLSVASWSPLFQSHSFLTIF